MFGDKLLLLKKRAGLLAEINAFSGGFEASRRLCNLSVWQPFDRPETVSARH